MEAKTEFDLFIERQEKKKAQLARKRHLLKMMAIMEVLLFVSAAALGRGSLTDLQEMMALSGIIISTGWLWLFAVANAEMEC